MTLLKSAVPLFDPYGGIKADATKQRYHDMMATFRRIIKDEEYTTARRTGKSEEVHWALWGLLVEQDDHPNPNPNPT